MCQNSIKSPFFARRAKKALAKGRSPPQELEVGPRSELYLLVLTKLNYSVQNSWWKTISYFCESGLRILRLAKLLSLLRLLRWWRTSLICTVTCTALCCTALICAVTCTALCSTFHCTVHCTALHCTAKLFRLSRLVRYVGQWEEVIVSTNIT